MKEEIWNTILQIQRSFIGLQLTYDYLCPECINNITQQTIQEIPSNLLLKENCFSQKQIHEMSGDKVCCCHNGHMSTSDTVITGIIKREAPNPQKALKENKFATECQKLISELRMLKLEELNSVSIALLIDNKYLMLLIAKNWFKFATKFPQITGALADIEASNMTPSDKAALIIAKLYQATDTVLLEEFIKELETLLLAERID